MKVGILTFHCALNYGAVLQCYALQEYLKSVGHDVYVIDYRPDYLVQFYKVNKKENWSEGKDKIRAIVRESVRFPFRVCRHKSFERFIVSNLRLYSYKPENDYSDFDAIIYGSDQIWNPDITGGGFDPVFFGRNVKCRKIVYAASNKNISLTDDERKYYMSVLNNFEYIGVRELHLQHLLQPLTLKKVYLNIDPTLLAGEIQFKSLDLSNNFKKDYVFIYEVATHQAVYKMSKQYAQKRNLKIVVLSSTIYANKLQERDQIASPDKWVRYIKYAQIVVTTSFHGVAFSILLKKNFYYVRQNNSSDYRIESILKQLNLMSRIIDMGEEILDTPIEYSYVQTELNKLRRESVKYIQEALLN